MYIAIEGIDTAGKSTQIEQLKSHFNDAIITKEPGATKIGKEIRTMVLSGEVESKKAEFLLFLADRAEHIQKVVKPNLETKMIISDRSAVSGVAYALVQGGVRTEDIITFNHFATTKIYPKKVYLLELTQKELEFRLSQKELDGIELRGVEYLLSIQDALLKASELLGIELVTIDATLSKEEITRLIVENINSSL
jgi:dTMP kinase